MGSTHAHDMITLKVYDCCGLKHDRRCISAFKSAFQVLCDLIWKQ